MQPFNSDRLSFRPFRREDAKSAFAFFGDPEVMRYSAFGVHPDLARTREMLADLIAHNRRRGFGFWAVIERATGELIGMAGLAELDPANPAGDIELAYRLRRDRWGQGFASEAAQAWVTQGFTVLNLARIVAVVELDHMVSRHILEKVGLRFVEQQTRHGKLVDFMVLERPQALQSADDRSAH